MTGNTTSGGPPDRLGDHAAMEPGRDDREHVRQRPVPLPHQLAAMEPGRDDREHF